MKNQISWYIKESKQPKISFDTGKHQLSEFIDYSIKTEGVKDLLKAHFEVENEVHT